jgi:hypothetical protein
MANTPRGPKRSWRDGGEAAHRHSPQQKWAGGKSGPAADGPSTGGGLSRRSQLILAGGALLVAVVVGIVVILMLRPNPAPRVIIIGPGNETNLLPPLNSAGQNALADVEAWAKNQQNWAGAGKEHGVITKRQDLTAGGDAFAEALKDCQDAKAVMLFVAAPGGGDPQGAYLLPRDARPDQLGSPYHMEKALAALGGLKRETLKFLVIDATEDPGSWPLRQVHNDFARALAAEPRLGAISNLVVLVSSSPDERSWFAEEYRRSIFLHYVLEGLKGAAARDNRVVTAQSLADYVKKQVSEWVRHTRGALQTPMLLDPSNLADQMELVTADRGAYQPPERAPYTDLAELQKLWEERAELARRSPPPEVHAPAVWRQYQDALLRYERLVRAGGDAGAANALRNRLSELRGEIDKADRLGRDAAGLTLALPAALGAALDAGADADRRQQDFEKRWKNRADDDARKLARSYDDDLGEIKDPTEQRLARLRLSRWLLGEAAKGEASPGAEAQARFGRVTDVLGEMARLRREVQPAEVQFALLLRRDLPQADLANPLPYRALRLRLLAEEAALGVDLDPAKGGAAPLAYGDQLPAWIHADVERADELRGWGQDLLLNLKTEEKRVKESFDQAEALYRQVQERARVVREALAVRDEALARLPYYTAWRAGQSYTGEDEDERAREKLAAAKIPLWAAVHALNKALENPPAAEKGGDDPVKAAENATQKVRDQLEGPAAKVRTGLRELAGEFDKSAEEREKDTARIQINWHHIDELLAVPFIAPERRIRLINLARDISRELDAQVEKAGGPAAVDKDRNGKLAKQAAQRQARLALAALGEGLLGRKEALGDVEAPGVEWWKTLNKVGDVVGEGFRRLASSAGGYADAEKKLLDLMLQAAADGKGDELRAKLQEAAASARRLDGALSAALPRDPIDDCRRLLLAELLAWQAERTRRDYLSTVEERDADRPYYRAAGKAFLDTALALAGRSDQLFAALARRLDEKDRFELREVGQDAYARANLPSNLAFVEEDGIGYALTVGGPGDAPAGYPVVWVKDHDKLTVLPGAERRALPGGPETKLDKRTLKYDLRPQGNPANKAEDQTTLTLEGRYRGRILRRSAPVKFYYTPDVTALQPERERGAMLAVQASDKVYESFTGKIEIVIVLDLSGSMSREVKGVSRLKRVLDAMKEALARMPRGVKVSLYTFSGARYNSSLNEVFAKESLDPEDVGRLMKKTEGLIPKDDTPLISSIVEARDKFSKDSDVSKTLVVLTDGIDNRFPDPANKIPDFLESKFRPKGGNQEGLIQLNVLAVDVDINTDPDLIEAGDPKKTERNRQAARETLAHFKEGVEKRLGGQYLDAASDNLSLKLATALARPRFYLFEGTGKVPQGIVPDKGADISRFKENYIWVPSLSRGHYRILIQTNRFYRAAEQLIFLEEGDALVLNLKDTPEGLRFQRQLYVESNKIDPDHLRGPRDAIKAPEGVWKVGMVQDQHVYNKKSDRRLESLNLMAVLEQDVGVARPEDVLKLNRPGLAWFRVRARDADGNVTARPPPGLRFYPLDGYPGPSYALEVPDWPEKDRKLSRPLVDAFWLDPNVNKLPFATTLSRRADDFSELPKAFPATYREGDKQDQVVLEAVELVRDRMVAVAPEVTQKRDCLVVRLRFPPGKPFFALPDVETTGGGSEHRLYLDAGKYTGVFWGKNFDDPSKLQSLQIIGLEAFQRRAISKENWELPEPDTKPRPEKPNTRVGRP